MLKKLLVLLGVALATFASYAAVAQSGRNVDNLEDIRRQIEIMKSVLGATLDFSELGSSRPSQIQSYYLPKQGAVFVIPVSLGDHAFRGDLEHLVSALAQVETGRGASQAYLRALERSMEHHQRDLERLQSELSGVTGGRGYVLAPPAPPLPPSPPAPPSGEEPEVAEAKREEIENRLQDVRRRLEEKKREIEQLDQAHQQKLEDLENQLLEAVAQHGDSLSAVGNDEYVTLILTEGGSFALLQGFRSRGKKSRILVVSKASIMDFNSGRISSQAFKNGALRVEM